MPSSASPRGQEGPSPGAASSALGGSTGLSITGAVSRMKPQTRASLRVPTFPCQGGSRLGSRCAQGSSWHFHHRSTIPTPFPLRLEREEVHFAISGVLCTDFSPPSAARLRKGRMKSEWAQAERLPLLQLKPEPPGLGFLPYGWGRCTKGTGPKSSTRGAGLGIPSFTKIKKPDCNFSLVGPGWQETDGVGLGEGGYLLRGTWGRKGRVLQTHASLEAKYLEMVCMHQRDANLTRDPPPSPRLGLAVS